MSTRRLSPPTTTPEGLIWRLPAAALGFTPETVWNPSPSENHRTEPYPLPQRLTIGLRGNALTSSKFSPPPMAVIVDGSNQRCYLGIEADGGWHLWNDAEFSVTSEGAEIRLDLEGITDAREAAEHIRLGIITFPGSIPRHQALAEGLALQYPGRAARPTPEWWQRPIYCGWGDQVAYAMAEEGVGPERRAMAYCIQGLYERWITRFEAAGVPIGTVTIDGGWSLTGVWEPDPIRWPDLRGFIDRQHAAGRKVLLWIGTWLWDGLPEELSIVGDGRQWTADPGNPKYLAQITRWVTQLLSPSGFNADGFKIDQLGFTPSRRRPRWCPRFGFSEEGDEITNVRKSGKEWGIELLYRYQKWIYDTAKTAKPDALITSSTVHPYFHDSFDMVRLHDMGSVASDIMAAMQARADLADAALPGFPIDTDDWIHEDYALWKAYTSRSHEIGVPCLFYTERFVSHWHCEPATRPITDLPSIAKAWRMAGYCPIPRDTKTAPVGNSSSA